MNSLLRSLLVLVVLLLGTSLTACDTSGDGPGGQAGDPGQEPETVTITAVATTWNGWDPDDDPVPETETFEVTEGDTFGIDVLTGVATFEVLSIEDGVVELRSDMELAPKNDPGYNYNDLVTEFTLRAGGSVVASTPTMDVATIVELTLS
ncbi:hypothetical protein [Nocardioides sp. AE5]|uniref:hypothetical protein n=1 Tax=Nocardioides sp. AE5 TaxID=2962573 RepID=UPI002880FF2F|nr:hypothetical protein [Nocardioides sp. AE5]MDT0202957.1 hypothetical protein [Nocardioides sp. AE5]